VKVKPGQIWRNRCIIGYKCFLGCLCGLDAWMHGSPSFFSPFSVVSNNIGDTLLQTQRHGTETVRIGT
jgi:hypothetical protein